MFPTEILGEMAKRFLAGLAVLVVIAAVVSAVLETR